MVRFNPLARRRPAPDAREALKARLIALLDLTPADLLSLNELACREEGCPPVETVIIVLHADGTTRMARVHKAMVDVDEADVKRAFGL